MGFIQHRDNGLHQSPVGTLSYTILMGFRTNSVLSMDAMRDTKRLPRSRDILPTLVIAQSLNLAVQLVLCKCLELLERCKSTCLALERQHYPEATEIINEGDPVLVMTSTLDWEWAMHIRVHQLQELRGTVLGKFVLSSVTLEGS